MRSAGKDSGEGGGLSQGELEEIRDRVLSRLKLGKGSQGAKAVREFIKELTE